VCVMQVAASELHFTAADSGDRRYRAGNSTVPDFRTPCADTIGTVLVPRLAMNSNAKI